MTAPVASVAEIIKRIHDSVAEEAECNAGGGLGPTHIMLRHRDALALCTAISDSVSLLREADQLWTTSWANQNRGVWDTDWNERRVAFLATFVAEKATTSEAPK